MDNVVSVVFNVESEAYQAFSELRNAPGSDTYFAFEAALLKREGGAINLIDGFDTGAYTSDDTARGMLVGAIAGILGGPLGVLLGASTGGMIGSTMDIADAASSASLIQQTAVKLYDGETAIVALVQEEEPAFDAVFAKYDTTIIRYNALTVEQDVSRAIEAYDEAQNLALQKMRADRKDEQEAKFQQRVEDRMANLSSYYEEMIGKNA